MISSVTTFGQKLALAEAATIDVAGLEDGIHQRDRHETGPVIVQNSASCWSFDKYVASKGSDRGKQGSKGVELVIELFACPQFTPLGPFARKDGPTSYDERVPAKVHGPCGSVKETCRDAINHLPPNSSGVLWGNAASNLLIAKEKEGIAEERGDE